MHFLFLKNSPKKMEQPSIKNEIEVGQVEVVGDGNKGREGKSFIWRSIYGYFSEMGLLPHQIDSYNNFIQHSAQMVIDANKELIIEEKDYKYVLTFGNLFFADPTYTINEITQPVYPTQCVIYNIGYMSKVFIDIKIKTPEGNINNYEKVELGDIPVMVMSCLCNLKKIFGDKIKMARYNEDFYDNGGYFIVKSKNADDENKNSQRKILVGQERQAFNKIYIFTKKKKPKYSIYSEIRSCTGNGMHSTTTTIGYLEKTDFLEVMLPWIDMSPIPLGIVFRALGVKDYEEIFFLIFGKGWKEEKRAVEMVVKTLEYTHEYLTRESALLYIGKKGKKFSKTEDDYDMPQEVKTDAISYAKHLLKFELFPHLTNQSLKTKKFFLGYMVKTLIHTILGKYRVSDRDHCKNRRDESVDALLTRQFHSAIRRIRVDLASHTGTSLQKGNKTINILSWLKTSILTNYMTSAIVSNNWGAKGVNNKSIAQVYEQFNYNSSFSSARKLVIPMRSEGGKILAPRDVHGSHWGNKCPSESPEGKSCGLVTNLALFAKITIGTDPSPIVDIISTFDCFIDVKFIDKKQSFSDATKVFVNGDWIGFTSDPYYIVNILRKLRRNLDIHVETSVSFNPFYNQVLIYTEGGRFTRPLFIVENNELLFIKFKERIKQSLEPGQHISFNALLENGIAEFIDQEEMENCVMAGFAEELEKNDKKYTHVEFHPCLIYGVGAQTVPFGHHNQSPRISYQAGMNKQAIGIPFTNYRQNLKGSIHVLSYTQKQLAASRTSKIIGMNTMPTGQNAITLVNSSEFNEEDSLELGQGPIDRGFMRSVKITVFYLEARLGETFKIPNEIECKTKLKGDPSKLTKKGVVGKGTKVKEGDYLIGKVLKKTVEKDGFTQTIHIDKSIKYDHMCPGTVDGIMHGINGEGYEFYKVSVAETRTPRVGDKYSSNYGQKGVISSCNRQEDMPFSARDGTSPDIIINSLAFPSRMTIGMLLEMLTTKILCSTYKQLHKVPVRKFLEKMRIDKESGGVEKEDTIDATCFEMVDLMGLISKAAISLGFQSFGDEMMIDGKTGEPFKGLMFVGPVYYQKLKHMVVDKVHFRSRGGRTGMYRQPNEGRAQGGGIRAGVMERDCLLGQGVARLTSDRLVDNSDKYHMFVCDICGLVPTSNIKNNKPEQCTICGSNKFTRIKIPYAAKLVMQELMGMNIVPRLVPTKRE